MTATSEEWEHTACATCRLVVDRFVDEDKGISRWQHTGHDPDDHPVVPVPVADLPDVIMRCDFCLAPGAYWTLPVEDYEAAPGAMNRGDWGACPECAALLKVGDWDRVARRAWDSFTSRQGPGVPLAIFQDMYVDLRRHVTGEVHL